MPGDEAKSRNAVGIIGQIEPFEDTVETWTSYTERLEQYFEVIGNVPQLQLALASNGL
jgi:hypothetical protein